jgi:uncharacterized circularly permuted ATP-grasp superfamily protein
VFDEMHAGAPAARPPYATVADWLANRDVTSLAERQREAEAVFRKGGITFSVYGTDAAEDLERPVPFDVLPRVFSAAEWRALSAGLKQRARALNAFLADVHGDRAIVEAGVMPATLLDGHPALLRGLAGISPPGGVHASVIAIDVARTGEHDFVVIEDNCRIPSGVSYMLEDRETMSRLFPDLIERAGVRRIDDYPQRLRALLERSAPAGCEGPPNVVVLTPGPHNSAYYEHFYLADQMGAELVEGVDLHVEDGFVWVRTIAGPERVDVIYRRIDDAFLDPSVGREDSLIGVRGLMDVYRAGNVSLVNAPGCGIADDKAVYAWVPQMIRFYLGETPRLANADVWLCSDPAQCEYVLAHLDELVLKPVQGAGAEGVVIGPQADGEALAAARAAVLANPAGFIAQQPLALSRCPTLVPTSGDGGALELRHVDFRAFVLCSADAVTLLPGGLTRVAPDASSLIVNTRQGGGVKDTWVLER